MSDEVKELSQDQKSEDYTGGFSVPPDVFIRDRLYKKDDFLVNENLDISGAMNLKKMSQVCKRFSNIVSAQSPYRIIKEKSVPDPTRVPLFERNVYNPETKKYEKRQFTVDLTDERGSLQYAKNLYEKSLLPLLWELERVCYTHADDNMRETMKAELIERINNLMDRLALQR